MTEIGLVLGSTLAPALLPEVGRAAEDAGFSRVWISEDYFYTGGVAGAAIVLGATRRIQVGIGLLSIYARHPALTAMEAGALAGAHPGRFILGFGTGVYGWLDQVGIPHAAPLGTMRESVDSVRSLLRGEHLDSADRFTFDDVALAFPPSSPPPIVIGATGPKMTALTGEIADGLLISVLSTPAFVRRSRGIVDPAAESAGRPRPKITALAIFSLADTLEEARSAARPVIANYLSHGANELTDAAGISEQLTAILERGGGAALERDMPDAWIERLSVCGDAEACRAAIEALGDAGVDEVALMPVDSTDLADQTLRAGSVLQLLGGA